MGRSQRHKVIIQNTDSTGKGLSEKQPAPRYVNQYAASQAFSVPTGAPGGPLQGSSMAGFPPTLIPLPGLDEQFKAETQAEGGFSDPGQFNLSGNPIHTSLPEASGPYPEPGEELTLLALAPDSLGVDMPPLTIHVYGTKFTEEAVVATQFWTADTEFIDDTHLAFLMDPEGVEPGTVEVYVQQGSAFSETKTFTYLAPGEPPARGARGTRNDPAEPRRFPIGPFGVARIEKIGESLQITLTSGGVQAGDFVRIEATRSEQLNGDYRVDNTEGSVILVRAPDVELAQAVTNRGRVTIISGGE